MRALTALPFLALVPTQPTPTQADTPPVPPAEVAFIQQVAEEYLIGLFDLDGAVEPVDIACAVSYAPDLSATGGTCYATIARTSSLVVVYVVHEGTQVTASIAGEYVLTAEGSFPEYTDNPDYVWTFTTTASPAPGLPPSAPIAAFDFEFSNVRTERDSLNNEYLCIDIAATNRGNVQAAPFGIWSAIRPSGVVSYELPVVTSEFDMVSTLAFSVVVPGAVTRGTKCFQTGAERGVFTVQYQDMSGAFGSWTFELP